MVQIKVTMHLDEDRTIDAEEAKNKVKNFCNSVEKMSWVETIQSNNARPVKLVFIVNIVDGEHVPFTRAPSYVLKKLQEQYMGTDKPLAHNITTEFK